MKNNKKILYAVIFIAVFILMLILMPIKVYGYTNQRVFDYADVLTDQEEKTLNDKIDKLYNKYNITAFIYFTDDEKYLDYSYDFRDDMEIFGEENIGESYIGLSVNVVSRDYTIDVYGQDMFNIYTDRVQMKIEDKTVSELRYDNWYDAAYTFLTQVEKPESKTEELVVTFGGAFLIALIASFITTSAKSRAHIEKRVATTASNYITQNNVIYNVKQDKFLTTRTTKVLRNTGGSSGGHRSSGSSHTSTHHSSSGHSHSGRSGKF